MKIFVGITIGTAVLLLLGLLFYFAKTRKRQPGNDAQAAQVSAKTTPRRAPSAPSPKELIVIKKRELIAKSGRTLTPVSLAMRMIEKEREGMIGNVIKKWLGAK
jgi:hypothetical protein